MDRGREGQSRDRRPLLGVEFLTRSLGRFHWHQAEGTERQRGSGRTDLRHQPPARCSQEAATGSFQWGGYFLKHVETPLLQNLFAWKRDDRAVKTVQLAHWAPAPAGRLGSSSWPRQFLVDTLWAQTHRQVERHRDRNSPQTKSSSHHCGVPRAISNHLFSKNRLAEKSWSPALDYRNRRGVCLGLLCRKNRQVTSCPPPVTAPATGNAVQGNHHP